MISICNAQINCCREGHNKAKKLHQYYQSKRLYDAITQIYILILNTLDCIIIKIIARIGQIATLLCSVSNERAYGFVLLPEGAL